MRNVGTRLRLGSLVVSAERDRFVLSNPYNPFSEVELFESDVDVLLSFIDQQRRGRRGRRWSVSGYFRREPGA